MHIRTLIYSTALAVFAIGMGNAQAAPMGSELDLTIMPASGGMEGVGVVRPQDPVAMLFGNPATLTQLKGRNAFTLGASYIGPKLEASADGAVPAAGVTGPFKGSSSLKDLAMPHAVAIHRFSPKFVGAFGFTGVSGLGSDFRNVAGLPPLVADLKIFGGNMSAGYQVTKNISLGGTFTVGIGSLQIGTVDNTALVNDFGIGGSVGVTYDAGPVQFGFDYKAPLHITYESVTQIDAGGPAALSDFTLEQPQEFVIGMATTDKLFKDTVLELDFRYKDYDNAEGYQDFWKSAWRIALGGSHSMKTPFGKATLRLGYSYTSSILKDADKLGNSVGEFNSIELGGGPAPIGPTFIQLFQATVADGHWRQGVSLGMGLELGEILGMKKDSSLRMDVHANYGFDGEVQIGPFHNDGSIFAAGMGLTWNFD